MDDGEIKIYEGETEKIYNELKKLFNEIGAYSQKYPTLYDLYLRSSLKRGGEVSVADLTEKERRIIEKNLEEDRRAIQHITWQKNHPQANHILEKIKEGE